MDEDLFGKLMERMDSLISGNKNLEPVGTLGQKDLIEWTSIQEEGKELVARAAELKARRDLFWARLRRSNIMLRDRDTVQIEEGGLIMATKQTQKVPRELPDGLPTMESPEEE